MVAVGVDGLECRPAVDVDEPSELDGEAGLLGDFAPRCLTRALAGLDRPSDGAPLLSVGLLHHEQLAAVVPDQDRDGWKEEQVVADQSSHPRHVRGRLWHGPTLLTGGHAQAPTTRYPAPGRQRRGG